MTDLTGTVCLRCKQGQLEERCLQDDWDGTLTCGYCGAKENRWSVGNNECKS
jgi:hypothetical protein